MTGAREGYHPAPDGSLARLAVTVSEGAAFRRLRTLFLWFGASEGVLQAVAWIGVTL
jgi:hypothetical protein